MPRRSLAAPAIAILDEPLSGLDPVSARLANRAIRDYAAAGHTVLLSTHQMNLVESLCSRVFMIARGRRVLYGDLKTIKREHSHSNAIRVLSNADYRTLSAGRARALPPATRRSRRMFSCATSATADEFLGWLVANMARVETFERLSMPLEEIFVRSRIRPEPAIMNKALVVARWEFLTTVTRMPYIFAVVAHAALLWRHVRDGRLRRPDAAASQRAARRLRWSTTAHIVDLALAAERTAERDRRDRSAGDEMSDDGGAAIAGGRRSRRRDDGDAAAAGRLPDDVDGALDALRRGR